MPKNNKPELKQGEKFHRLTVLKFSHSDKRWRKWYLVRCDCGKEKIIMGSAVNSGNTKSCGCLASEEVRNRRISECHSEITAIILGYKRHAKDRGIKWLLSRAFVESLLSKNCFYCGIKPSNVKKTKSSLGCGFYYSGIDRINSDKDYTEHNVVACCRVCNYAKGNMTIDEFKLWAIRIGERAFAEQWG